MHRILFLLLLPLCAATCHAEEWGTNLADAVKQAKQQDKHILLNFTGSDWCKPCQQLDRKIFSKESFQQQAKKRFVLVAIDSPSKDERPKAQQEMAKATVKKFSVSAYPTVLLLDSKGRPYASTGFRDIPVDAYLKMLDDLGKICEQRDADFAGGTTPREQAESL
ncbi:MAG: thioredoxin family protein, partial [Planctomycetota bacterium]